MIEIELFPVHTDLDFIYTTNLLLFSHSVNYFYDVSLFATVYPIVLQGFCNSALSSPFGPVLSIFWARSMAHIYTGTLSIHCFFGLPCCQ